MIIHLYSVMKNEEPLLPYFLRHYSTFVDKIFIFDDRSIDKTVEIAKTNPKVVLLDYEYEGGLVVEAQQECVENAYKKYSRGVADWVICVDGDEFLYHDDIISVLREERDKSTKIIKATGASMISKTFPKTEGQIYEELFMGIRDRLYDKKVIFSPEIDVVFERGKHDTRMPKGIYAQRVGIHMLHYRYISKGYIVNRLRNSPAYNWGPEKLAQHIKDAIAWFDLPTQRII